MKKFVVLATNDVPKYLFYTPLVCWAWNKIGWHPIVFFYGSIAKGFGQICDLTLKQNINFQPAILKVEGYPSETIVQVSRLYGSCLSDYPHDYMMTSDIDMLPLSDYWQGNLVTSWGSNLSNEHYPIAYIGMPVVEWQEVMEIYEDDYNALIKNDLDKISPIKWTTDQDLITKRLDAYNGKIKLIDREIDKRTGYPIGRVDRSAWTLDHKVFIDAHLPHDILTNEKSYQKVMNLLTHIWPNESFKWFEEYYRDFKKLIK